MNDEFWMRQAIEEARRCLSTQSPTEANRQSSIANRQSPDVPVGAICVLEGEIIGRGHNRREAESDPTAHAEVLALREASIHMKSWRLEKVTLYVTLEPCPMCAGALWLSRIDRLVFGAWDEKAGACGSLLDIPRDPRLNHQPQVKGGILENECAQLLREFFAERRKTVDLKS